MVEKKDVRDRNEIEEQIDAALAANGLDPEDAAVAEFREQMITNTMIHEAGWDAFREGLNRLQAANRPR